MLINILLACEEEGMWPDAIELVLIALLPKPDGGFGPIGLLPTTPRIWMRARRQASKRWEEENKRPYLYAGKGMGANVAAWKQAALAEHAASLRHLTSYAQALLDLVKAFDKVPLWLRIREAIALKYPLRLLRLSIATYRLKRTIRIGKVISKDVFARCGITAGSGFATTEMRLVMIRAVDRALTFHRTITPTLFVDDLAAEVCGPAHVIKEELGGFIEKIAEFVAETGQELSPTKSLCTASSDELGKALCKRWERSGINIHFRKKVKA
jgi:hypothetical protein